MKKVILTLGLASLFLTGCAVTQNNTVSQQQQQWQEKNIKSNINALNRAPQFRGKIRVISEVDNGSVLLIGQAIDNENKQSIEAYVKNLQGVKKIYNQIRINKPISFDQRSQDTWLTTRVKSALLSDNRLDQYSIKVTTENKEVFLIGNLPPEEAQIAVDIARKIDGVSKVVKSFNYARDTQTSAKLEASTDNTISYPNSYTQSHDGLQTIESTTPAIEEVDTQIDENDAM